MLPFRGHCVLYYEHNTMDHHILTAALAQLQAGDTSAWNVVYDQLAQPLYRFFYLRVGDRHIAEDLTSRCFEKIFAGFQSFSADRAHGATWVYTIARRVLIDHLRRKHPVTLADSVAATLEVLPDYDPERYQGLTEAVAKLTPIQQEIIRLRFWEELGFSEIAQVMGTTEAAAKMQLRRGLNQIRKHPAFTSFLIAICTITYG
jgi:RNA polymerase sigma-70 factor, ECF subfamily